MTYLYKRDECGCGAAIIWAINRATRQPYPVDYDEIPTTSGACNVILEPVDNGAPWAMLINNQRQLFGKRYAHRSHFKTCPHAAWYQRRSSRRRAYVN